MKAQIKNRHQDGLTVIEVVITLFIIGVTLLLFAVAANSIVLNKSSKYKEIALRIADQKIQTVRNASFSSIPASGTFSDPQLSSLPNGQGNITVSDISATLKNVAVVVTWTNPKTQGTQQIQIQTYMSSGGLGQ